MGRKSNPQFVPPIEKSLLRRLCIPGSPDDWLIESATENIERFNELLSSAPKEYPWEFMSAEAFKQIGTTLASAGDLYRHYWHDMLGQIEAFSVMSAWRLGDISRSAVCALRRGDVVCAAIMCRAALETAASYAWLLTEIRPALEQMVGKRATLAPGTGLRASSGGGHGLGIRRPALALEVLERQLELLDLAREPLRGATELHTTQARQLDPELLELQGLPLQPGQGRRQLGLLTGAPCRVASPPVG